MSVVFTKEIFESNVTDQNTKQVLYKINSKYLFNTNGEPVMDPTFKPNDDFPDGRPYIIPADMDFDQNVKTFTDTLHWESDLLDFGTGERLDLQRRGIDGSRYGIVDEYGNVHEGFVSDYTSSASLYFGAVSGALSVPANIAEIGGGLLNLRNAQSNDTINTNGDYWNNPNNVDNTRMGLEYYQKYISSNSSVDALVDMFDQFADILHDIASLPKEAYDFLIDKLLNQLTSNLPCDSDLTYDSTKFSPYTPDSPYIPYDPNNPQNGHPFDPERFDPPRSDPLVLDLNKDGLISTVSLTDSTAFFDLTGDGIKEKVGWVQASEGIVAFDKNGNGKIDGIGEVFGTATTSGFEELRQLADSNYDGVIDRRDELYNQLKVWQDTNQDGISQASELKTLSQAGVNTIELNVFATNINLNGNLLTEAGRYGDTTGTRSLAADVELTFDSRITTVDTSLIPDYTIHPDTASLPKLRGYGVVYNSEIAYNVNDTLRNLAITMSADITRIANHFDDFMAEWTGLNDLLRTTQDKYHLSTPPTLSAIDTKVWIYERFLGQKNFSVTIEQAINSAALRMTTGGNPVAASRIPYRVAEVEQSYNTIQTRYQSYFTLQTFYPDIMANALYDISIEEFVISDPSVFAANVSAYMNSTTDNFTTDITHLSNNNYLKPKIFTSNLKIDIINNCFYMFNSAERKAA